MIATASENTIEMDSKSSKPWADTPYLFLEKPSRSQDLVCSVVFLRLSKCVNLRLLKSYPAIYIANEMAHTHNCMLRGLKAIYHQAPYVTTHVDIADLVHLTASWVAWLTTHHHMEENTVFPGFESALGKPGFLAAAVEQHDAFEKEVDGLRQYAALSKGAENFDAGELRKRIEALGPLVREHLADEVTMLKVMREICHGDDPEEKAQELLKVYQACVAEPGKQDKFVVVPLIMGLRDKTYEGGNEWPQVPSGAVADFAIANISSLKHRGTWRFLPCNFWGQPRPLAFLRKA